MNQISAQKFRTNSKLLDGQVKFCARQAAILSNLIIRQRYHSCRIVCYPCQNLKWIRLNGLKAGRSPQLRDWIAHPPISFCIGDE